ncbi:MAG TPA: GNAT family N-acetyltransferase [Spirochaetota bacterium]|nr:GNAT family N-acetyltransferase [Spirochaetota bacterium]HOM38227.1 GNAT family N-acetyltransferase [Spirochaetota bacterium]HPQ48555.1 GNAT family N-acetyltransferase [Spirochaetota bacterium]
MDIRSLNVDEKEYNEFINFFRAYLEEVDPEFENKKHLIDKYCKLVIINNKYKVNWILVNENKAGFFIWYIYDLYKGKKGLHVSEFYVLKEYRRRGIGTFVLNNILSKFDLSEIRLEAVIKNTVAVKFWKSLGFKPYKFIMKKTEGF